MSILFVVVAIAYRLIFGMDSLCFLFGLCFCSRKLPFSPPDSVVDGSNALFC